jgi:hypothetical protein
MNVPTPHVSFFVFYSKMLRENSPYPYNKRGSENISGTQKRAAIISSDTVSMARQQKT